MHVRFYSGKVGPSEVENVSFLWCVIGFQYLLTLCGTQQKLLSGAVDEADFPLAGVFEVSDFQESSASRSQTAYGPFTSVIQVFQ